MLWISSLMSPYSSLYCGNRSIQFRLQDLEWRCCFLWMISLQCCHLMKTTEGRKIVLSSPAHSNKKKVFRSCEKMLEGEQFKEMWSCQSECPFCLFFFFFSPPSIGYLSWRCCSLPYQHAHIYKKFLH